MKERFEALGRASRRRGLAPRSHSESSLVLFVSDFFQPVDRLAIELFLNGDVRHGRCWGGAVPMLLARRERNHVAWPDLLDRASPALRAAAARGHDQRLAKRMGMPRCSSAWFEGNTGAEGAGGRVCLEQGIDTHCPGKPIGRSLVDGCEPTLLISMLICGVWVK